MQNPPLVRIGGQQSRSLYQYTLQAQDLNELYRSARRFRKAHAGDPGLFDVNTDLQIASPEVIVDIDRDRASALGVTADQIEDALYDAYGARQVSDIYTPTNDYWVIMELLPRYQRDPECLASALHPVGQREVGPIGRRDEAAQHRRPAFGDASGAIALRHHLLQPGARRVAGRCRPESGRSGARTLPAGVHTTFQGAAAAFQSSLRGMGLLLVLAILVIYMVLGILYESFIHPLTILSGLPSAGLGALATLLIFHDELNIYSFVGIIMLIGIVKKNAIMMIDFALEAQRTQGMTPAEAIYEACLVRFRPIMMTTMAALMGTLPIALGLARAQKRAVRWAWR